MIETALRFPERGLRAVRVYGVRAAAARVARMLVRRVRAHRRHSWYELDLRSPRSRSELLAGFALSPAEEPDLARIAELPEAPSVPVMRRLRAEGHDLWNVQRAGRVAFLCWIFCGRAPVGGVKGGWIDLPGTIVCLEDSLTARPFRGLGIAPAAWCALADRLEEEGVHTIVTKVESWNRPSRAAVTKAGFRETAEMTLDRAWGRTRVAVVPAGGGTGRLLADLITERAPTGGVRRRGLESSDVRA